MLEPAGHRPRLRERGWDQDPDKSVFINCPFDAEYAPLFDAVVFATVCCGFEPRSALEEGTVAEPRMARITRALFNSRYSIHDLSRCTGAGNENLARFNMPLELGIAMARRFLDRSKRHDWLILVPEGHAYQRFISDMAGYDPLTHDGSIESLISAVTLWLTTRGASISSVTPDRIIEALPKFQRIQAKRAKEWRGRQPWFSRVLVARGVAAKFG